MFRQFSFPGGVPSHVAPEIPGSIHEGGELGYSLTHAFGAAFDNPDLVVACVVGDGEAETGPLATSWHSNKFLDPVRDGAVLPILHLNGYKIANPTVLARISEDELDALLRRARVDAVPRRGRRPGARAPAARRDARPRARRDPAAATRGAGLGRRDAPALADDRVADAQGLDRPRVRRRPSRRRHVARAPGAALRGAHQPGAPRACSTSGCAPTGRASCSTTTVRRSRSSSTGCRKARARMCANPHANGGVLLRDLDLPDFRDYGVEVERNGTPEAEATRVARPVPPRRVPRERAVPELPAVRPGRDRVQPARRGVRSDRQGVAGRDPAGGRAPLAARPRDGDPQRAHVRRLARGLPAHGPARLLQLLRSVHAHHRFDVQPAREVARDRAQARVAAQHLVVELPADFARVAPGPQRLHAPGSRVSSTSSSTRRRASCACTCRPTRTACSRSPTIACGPATTSTSSSPGSSPNRRGCRSTTPCSTARGASAYGTGRASDGTRGARCRHGVRGRRAHARDARGGEHAARAPPRPRGTSGQCRRPDAPPAGAPSIRTGSTIGSSTRSSRPTSRSSSRSTATRT